VLTHREPVNGLCFDSKNETLAVAAGAMQLWDLKRAPPLAISEAPFFQSQRNGSDITFTRDGSTLFYVDGIVVRRWEVARPYREADSETGGSITGVPSSSLGVTADPKQLLFVVERNSGSEILTRNFATLSAAPKSLVSLTDIQIDDLSVSPDGLRFVFSAYRHPRYTLELWEQDAPKKLDVADLQTGHPGSFWCSSFRPDGVTLATGHRDGAIRLWDIGSGKLKLRSTVPNVNWGGIGGLAYSPDGSLLASVDWDGGVNLWDASGESMHRKATLGQHDARAYTVQFSQDGRILASGDSSGVIKLWNIDENPPQATHLTKHTANISSLFFAPDARELLSSGFDGRVIIWDVAKAVPRREWNFPGPICDAQFDPTGQQVVSANGNGSIYVWKY
jgi:WD40 repeat protein